MLVYAQELYSRKTKSDHLGDFQEDQYTDPMESTNLKLA